MSKNFKQAVVSYGLEYSVSYILLEYMGFKFNSTLYTSFNKAIDDLDGFLFSGITKDHPVYCIGFPEVTQKSIKEFYDEYTDFIFLYNKEGGTLLRSLYKKCNKDKLNDKQKQLIHLTLDWSSNEFKLPNSYVLNMSFRLTKNEKFYNLFKDGFKIDPIYKGLIKQHIKDFKEQLGDIYKISTKKYGTFYVVNSSVIYLDDYLYKYFNKIDNIVLIDSPKKRVYFRRKQRSEVNILDFCKLTTKGNGHEYACSGNLTNDFINISKVAKKVEIL